MNSVQPRRWYRLHFLTWIAVLLECTALAYCQVVRQFGPLARNGVPPGGTYVVECYFGWPAVFEKQIISGVMTIPPTADRPTFKYAWHFPSLAFDSLVSLLLVISVMWVMEAWLRKPKRWQFSIRALGVWFAVVAVVLTILKQRSIVQKWIVDLGFAPGRPFEPHFESPGTDAWGWATIVAMLFGIGCFIWCFIHQTSRAASYLMRRLKPV